MITALLVAVAVYALAGQQIAEKVKAWYATAKMPTVDGKHVAAIALLVAAAIAFAPQRQAPTPTPAPAPPDAFTLRGGPVTPESRAAWVSALRDLSRAASDVTR